MISLHTPCVSLPLILPTRAHAFETTVDILCEFFSSQFNSLPLPYYFARQILKQLNLTRATQTFLEETLPADLLEYFPKKSILAGAGEEGGAAAS